MSCDCFLAVTAAGRWHPGIGDPTLLGWVTAIAYIAAALVCWSASRTATPALGLGEKRFWLGFAVFMFLLGINKQLDLQTGFTQIGRWVARSSGWYENRRAVQAVFILLLITAGAGLIWFLWRIARHAAPQHRFALVGAVFLVSFVVIRAASFHHFDQMLGWHWGKFRMNHFLELGGIAWIGIAATRAWQTHRKHCGPQGPHKFVLAGRRN